MHTSRLQSAFSNPFNPLIIFNPDEMNILFYTQSFAKLIGYHSSTDQLPFSIINKLVYPINRDILDNNYAILQCEKFDANYQMLQKYCLNECIHELRTSSMLIDLGIDIITRNGEDNKDILQKLKHATHRQKISTLIASDFLQLLSTRLIISPTPLTQIIKDSISLLQEPHQVQVNSTAILTSTTINSVNPFIFADPHFLKNFFTTLFLWLEKIPIILDIEVLNPVSVAVSINTPYENLLSVIPAFNLITNYIQYVIAYFNGRVWITQSSINMIFKLIK